MANEDFARWRCLCQAGEQAIAKGCYQQAKEQFAESLREAEKSGPQDRHVAVSLGNIARCCFLLGQFDEEIAILHRLLAMEQACRPSGESVAFAMPRQPRRRFAPMRFDPAAMPAWRLEFLLKCAFRRWTKPRHASMDAGAE